VVVTVSEFSKAELTASYRWLDPASVIVTPNAAGPLFFTSPTDEQLAAVRARYRLPERFLLAVGNLQPRKNLPIVIGAATQVGLPLMIVGQAKWLAGGLQPRAMPPEVHLLGYVPTTDLVALYRLCAAFVYPSLYEGFGIPVLEAMAAGAPVVTSATSALPEVAGGAAVLVDPSSPDSVAAGIEQVVGDEDEAARLADLGRRRAGQFSWTKSAAVLLRAVRQLDELSRAG
jgi:glycosyltransferase involved in cell wall biosynthesis